MTSILTDLASIVGDAVGPIFFDATLTRKTLSTPTDPYDASTAAETSTTYSCKAIHEEYSAGYHQRGLVEVGDFKFLVLANGLSVEPKPGDFLSIPSRGASGTVVPENSGMKAVTTDPAKAVWTCRCRK